jgi:hypothetical protein
MAKSGKRWREREQKRRELKRRELKRTVVNINEDGTKTKMIQSGGYDVPMIRDFLAHLLWEVRINHFELESRLNQLYKPNLADGPPQEPVISPDLVEQLAKYHAKYCSALLPASAFGGEDCTVEEQYLVEAVFCKRTTIKRQKQIEHLEALQDLFDEALQCAKMPFGKSSDGDVKMPTNYYNVREIYDAMEKQHPEHFSDDDDDD